MEAFEKHLLQLDSPLFTYKGLDQGKLKFKYNSKTVNLRAVKTALVTELNKFRNDFPVVTWENPSEGTLLMTF